MIKDYFKISFLSLKNRKLRTGLTLMGVFIGIALLVVLMSLGTGLKMFMTNQFEQMGSNKLFIHPGKSMFENAFEGAELREHEFNAVKRTKGVETVAGSIYKIERVKLNGESKYSYIIGMPSDEKAQELFESMLASFKIEQGRRLNSNDKFKATVGIDVATDKKLFKKGVKLNDKIEILGKRFTVVGVYGRVGNPQDDSNVYITLDTARSLFNEPDKYDYIIAEVSENEDVTKVAEAVKKNLRKVRGLKEGEEDFTVQTPEQMLDSFSTVLTIIQVVLIGLAAISLLVGGISIANTMYMAILDRTREIGIMKSIGAKTTDIVVLFLIESGLIGLGAGLVGIIMGSLVSKLIEFAIHASGYSMLNVNLSTTLLAGSLLFAFVFGVISGLIPAIKASKLNPVEALRYE